MKRHYFAITLIATLTLLATACGNNENTIYPVQIGDNWGYVTAKGKYVVNPSYESAGFFHCGLARIVKDGKVGYINTKGKIVIEPVYQDGSTFSEKTAFVVKEGETPQCINTSGKILFTLPDWVETVYNYRDGFAKVKTVDNEVTYLNRAGKEVLTRSYDGLSFNEGLTWREDTSSTGFKDYYVDTKGKIRFEIDPDKMTIFYENAQNNSCFCDGLAAMKGYNGKYGYIDAKGNILIDFQFDEANNFSEGLALVKTGKKYGYVNKKGEYVINPQFTDARSFHEGMAAVKQGDSWGYINTTGTLVVNPNYSVVCDYLGGYALVLQDDKVGIIDRKGKMVVNPQFDSAWLSAQGGSCNHVSSMKYTGTAFVPNFLKRYDAGSWDGVNASTTLGEIRAKFKNVKADGDFQFVCETSLEPVDGITLSNISFFFNEKTYKLVDNYVNNWLFTYKSGKKRQYNNSIKVYSIVYTFSLNKSTQNKIYSIAKTLAEGMALEMDAYVEYQTEDEYEGFLITKDEQEIAGVLIDRTNNELHAAILCQ